MIMKNQYNVQQEASWPALAQSGIAAQPLFSRSARGKCRASNKLRRASEHRLTPRTLLH